MSWSCTLCCLEWESQLVSIHLLLVERVRCRREPTDTLHERMYIRYKEIWSLFCSGFSHCYFTTDVFRTTRVAESSGRFDGDERAWKRGRERGKTKQQALRISLAKGSFTRFLSNASTFRFTRVISFLRGVDLIQLEVPIRGCVVRIIDKSSRPSSETSL